MSPRDVCWHWLCQRRIIIICWQRVLIIVLLRHTALAYLVSTLINTHSVKWGAEPPLPATFPADIILRALHTVTHKNEKTAPGTFITGWYYRGAGPNVPQLIFFSGRIIFCVPSWVIHTHNSRFIRVSHNVVHCKSTPYATKSSRLRAKLARVPRSNAAAGKKLIASGEIYCSIIWFISKCNLR